MASRPSQPRDATAPPAPPACACRSSSPRPLAFAPAARPPVGRRPIRPSRPSGRPGRPAVSCTAAGRLGRPSAAAPPAGRARGAPAARLGPRRRRLPPAARLAAGSLPRLVDGGGGSRRGRGAAAGGRRAEAAGGRRRGLQRPYAAAPERPEAWSAGHRRPASLHVRLPWRVALFHCYCSALGHLSGWLRHWSLLLVNRMGPNYG